MNAAAILSLLILLAACAPTQADKDLRLFQDACLAHGDGWMRMQPTINGTIVKGAAPCFGCMIGDTHYCDFREFARDAGLDKP